MLTISAHPRRKRAIARRVGRLAALALALASSLAWSSGTEVRAKTQRAGCDQPPGPDRSLGLVIRRCLSERRLWALKSAVNQRRANLDGEERQTADELVRLSGIGRAALDPLLRNVSTDESEPEELVDRLVAKIGVHKDLLDEAQEQLAKAAAKQSWGKIVAAIEDGRYDAANDMAAALREDEMFLSGGHGGAGKAVSEGAAAAEAVIAYVAMTQSRFAEAADHFGAAAQLAGETGKTHDEYDEVRADALYLQSNAQWSTDALRQAAQIYRALLQARPRAAAPELWAATQDKLSDVLLRFGVARRSASIIGDAVAARMAVLEVRSRDTVPLQWARAEGRLGAALFRLGVSGQGVEELEKSVAAYQAALSETHLENAPEEWVALQNGLGAALWSLGSREKGTESLEEAVTAFSDALKGLDFEDQPRDWGAMQNNLGAALFALAERETGEASAGKAVEAFKASLAAYREASAPYFIVGVKKSLARAEQMLAERQARPRSRARGRGGSLRSKHSGSGGRPQ